jgi:hypothetical protein
MKTLFATVLAFALSLSPALAAPFVSPEWEQIQAKILKEGKTIEAAFGTTMYLMRENGNEKNYLTALVEKVNGQLRIKNVSAVTEISSLRPDGTREMDQWIFWLGREVGELITTARYHMVFDANNLMVERKELTYGKTPTMEEHFRWQNTLGDWYKIL